MTDTGTTSGWQPDRLPLLLTADEVGEIMGISGKSVRRYAESGELPVIRVGSRNVRFEPQDVAAWIRRNRQAEGSGS